MGLKRGIRITLLVAAAFLIPLADLVAAGTSASTQVETLPAVALSHRTRHLMDAVAAACAVADDDVDGFASVEVLRRLRQGGAGGEREGKCEGSS